MVRRRTCLTTSDRTLLIIHVILLLFVVFTPSTGYSEQQDNIRPLYVFPAKRDARYRRLQDSACTRSSQTFGDSQVSCSAIELDLNAFGETLISVEQDEQDEQATNLDDDSLLTSAEDEDYSSKTARRQPQQQQRRRKIVLRKKNPTIGFSSDEAIYVDIESESVQAVLVRTEKGVTGNIPLSFASGSDAEIGGGEPGFLHIAPCESVLEENEEATPCHTLTRVSIQQLSREDVSHPLGDTIVWNGDDQADTPISSGEDQGPSNGSPNPGYNGTWWVPPSAGDEQTDPQCAQGRVSGDYKYCCPKSTCSQCSIDPDCSGPCCYKSISGSRSCFSYGAPCFMMAYHRVSVAYTTEVRQTTVDLMGMIRLAVAETNAGYEASQVPLRLILADVFESDIADTGDSYSMLIQFQNTNRRSGNIGVLLSNRLSSCGRGFLDCARYSTDNCAYAVVKASCATGYYSFGHEIGHVQGLDHNSQFASDPYSRFTDNHGHVLTQGFYEDGAKRTVMAYSVIDEERILVFSNPDIVIDGKPAGVAGVANNARVLRYTRYAVARLNMAPNAPISFTLAPTSKDGSGEIVITGSPVPPTPTRMPTTLQPTAQPTPATRGPTTLSPTRQPTNQPTLPPTKEPTSRPTKQPTVDPTVRPTLEPTLPTSSPTVKSTFDPTSRPTKQPTLDPTSRPSKQPTLEPTQRPTKNPTAKPTTRPTSDPTTRPTLAPTTLQPTKLPTLVPTLDATSTREPTLNPTTGRPTTTGPTKQPTTNVPTLEPTLRPTKQPTEAPTQRTKQPTFDPTFAPTRSPVEKPTKQPTNEPTTKPSRHPTNMPTARPSGSPVTSKPTLSPTNRPTKQPTSQRPSLSPTTARPTQAPTNRPTKQPTSKAPTNAPTSRPSKSPSTPAPTSEPTTKQPTMQPSARPTTSFPTNSPTFTPSAQPSAEPTVFRWTRFPTVPAPTRSEQAKDTFAPSTAPGHSDEDDEEPFLTQSPTEDDGAGPIVPAASTNQPQQVVTVVAAAGIPMLLVGMALTTAFFVKRQRSMRSANADASYALRRRLETQLTHYHGSTNTPHPLFRGGGDGEDYHIDEENPVFEHHYQNEGHQQYMVEESPVYTAKASPARTEALQRRANAAQALAQASPPRKSSLFRKYHERPLGSAASHRAAPTPLTPPPSRFHPNPPLPPNPPPVPPSRSSATMMIPYAVMEGDEGDFNIFTPPPNAPVPPSPPPSPPPPPSGY